MPERIVEDPAVLRQLERNSEKLKPAPPGIVAQLEAETELPFDTFMNRTSRGLINMALETPNMVGEVAALLPAIPRLVPGGRSFMDEFRAQQEQNPAKFLRELPTLDIDDIAAGVSSIPALVPGGVSPGEAFETKRQALFEREQAAAEANPFAAVAGDVAANVLALVGARAPIAGGVNRLETRLFGRAASDPKSIRFLLDKTVTSNPMRRLARGAGRSVETGMEAAVLDLLHGDDPLETAAYAAAGQLAGSGLLQFAKTTLSGHPGSIAVKLGVSAFAAATLFEMVENITPGDTWILQSLEAGFDKVTWAIALGGLSGAVGAGRLRGTEFAEAWPKLADALSTIPRASTLSLVESLVDADEETQRRARSVMNQLMQDPGAFGEDNVNRLNRALEQGDFLETIDRLSAEDRRFANQLFSTKPPNLDAAPKRGVIQRNAQDSR